MMFSNYLKIASRYLIMHRGYSFINISGLAIGMACCLLIFLFIEHEMSYDRYHENSDRIYRLALSGRFGGTSYESAAVAAPTAQALVQDYPFEYSFMDERFEAMYRTEQRLGTIFSLFALVSFLATQNTKEIGIRKVLGASKYKIFMLLMKGC